MLAAYGATVLVITALTHLILMAALKARVNLLGEFFSGLAAARRYNPALVNRTVSIFPGIAVAGWLLLV